MEVGKGCLNHCAGSKPGKDRYGTSKQELRQHMGCMSRSQPFGNE